MSKNGQSEKPQHRSKIGGQALIEGVMMKGVDTGAMACRLPDGTIDVETWEENNGKNMPWYRKCPFVRGIFNFVAQLGDGMKYMNKSMEKSGYLDDEEEEPSKFEKWLSEKGGKSLTEALSGVDEALKKIDSINIDDLNEAITDLKNVVGPLAKLFGKK